MAGTVTAKKVLLVLKGLDSLTEIQDVTNGRVSRQSSWLSRPGDSLGISEHEENIPLTSQLPAPHSSCDSSGTISTVSARIFAALID